MQTNNNSAFDLPIIPLAILNSIISQFPGLYNGTFPIRDPNNPRHRSYASRRSQGRTPRPSNPFLLFRAFLVRNKDVLAIDNKHQYLSKIAGEVWKLMSEEERRPWYDEAEVVKEEHSRGYAYSPTAVSLRTQKRQRSEGEKRAADLRSYLAATQIRQAKPDTSESASGNERDGSSGISTISDGTTPSLASSSSSSAGSTSASIVSYAIGNNLCPMGINGIQRTSRWVSQLTQQSPFPATSQTAISLSAAAGTISPANLTMEQQQQQPVDIWALREANNEPTFTGSSSSSSTTSTFGINVSSSSTVFGQTCWNTGTTRSGSTSACPGSSKGKERQVYYDDSDDDFYGTNEDDAIDEDFDDY